MKYGIVVDSGCDLKELDNKSTNVIRFDRAPLKLMVGEKEFTDDFSLNIEEYMKEAAAYKGKTGSAAPSPQDWINAYQQSELVFAITITSELSGSYQSAVMAKDMLLEDFPNKRICVIDSKSAGPEVTLLVRKLTELMEQELSFEEIEEKIRAYQEQTHLLFVLESLDNLMKNGRVGKLTGGIAGLLGIRILGAASEQGTLEVIQKCRGKLQAYDRLLEEMIKRGYRGGKVIISHSFNEEKALLIKDKLEHQFPNFNIEIMPTSGLCSFYAEQGGILLSFEE